MTSPTQPTCPPMLIHQFNGWLQFGERGLSSEAIVTQLTGVHLSGRPWTGWDHPHDPSDFRRCERLLRQVPQARVHLVAMKADPVWARLVDAWDELVALAEEEVPGCFDGPPRGGAAPRLYARMRELREAIA
ncbi:hypothetical protein ACFVH4_18900 [Nocardia ignorata]|uniref:hypothetical protein n=1 Tax=Nocardia ignorata TaxID=145285 RepID=UPI003633A96D